MIVSDNRTFLIVDHCKEVCEEMIILIKDEFVNPTIHSTNSLEGIFAILEKGDVDVIIMDINFTVGNSLNTIREVRILQPNIKILIFTAYDEDVYAVRYLNTGASGYLNKGSSEVETKNALEIILLSEKYISERFKNKILNCYLSKMPINPIEKLSNKEIEVAKLFINGQENLQISKKLKIQITTVNIYKKRIFEKLEINNMTLLIEIFQLYCSNTE